MIGPNGAGKTSLFNLISGLRRPTAARSSLAGQDITGSRRTAGPAGPRPHLPVLVGVRLAERARERPAGRAGPPRRLDAALRRARDPTRRSPRAADGCWSGSGWTTGPTRLAGTLAHGEKRKLEIALLLAGEPRVLLLDEPMAGVSAEDVPALVAVIETLTGDSGAAVLMVEHHMDVVLDLADRVAVMHHGALLICDTPEVVMADRTVQEAYLGEGL